MTSRAFGIKNRLSLPINSPTARTRASTTSNACGPSGMKELAVRRRHADGLFQAFQVFTIWTRRMDSSGRFP